MPASSLGHVRDRDFGQARVESKMGFRGLLVEGMQRLVVRDPKVDMLELGPRGCLLLRTFRGLREVAE